MDHEDLRVLFEVVSSGSIQGAASRLRRSRSSLSRRLDALEAEVGVPLLHRDAAGVRLTPAGSVVLEQGRSVLESCRSLLADARAAAAETTGVLRIIAPVGLPPTANAQALVATHRAAPKLRLIARHVEDPIKKLHEPCELMLHEGPAPDKGSWFSRVVTRLPLRVLASPAYLEARGVPREVSELRMHDILGWKRPNHRADTWPLRSGGFVDVSPWFVSPDPMLLRAVARQSGGLVLGAVAPFLDEPGAEPLVPVLEDQIGAEIAFRASTPQSTSSDPRARSALEQLQTMLAGFAEE